MNIWRYAVNAVDVHLHKLSTMIATGLGEESGAGHLNALKYGGVLAVGGEQVDAVLSCQGQHVRAACNEGLLVG